MQANSTTTKTADTRRFTLGQTFITPGAEEALQIAGQTAKSSASVGAIELLYLFSRMRIIG